MRTALSRALFLLLAWTATALAEPALEPPTWDRVADVETVEVVTRDADGSPRETTVWLAVLDGQGYVRTGGSTWGGNLERDPQLVLRIGEDEYALRVEMIEDDALRGRIAATFREKYGFTDAALDWIRGHRPKMMRLLPRRVAATREP
jgi:hypothetical protein